jgi:integrase
MAKRSKTEGTFNGYDVESYLAMLRLSKRSESTILGYRKVLKSYADFIGVPLTEVHRHLLVSNLLKYAVSRNGKSDAGTKTNLSILHRYFEINGVKFDELQYNAMKPKINKETNDKPLELTTLQKLMDSTDVHGRALISFLISTGCRADETCNIHLSDVKGDVVTVRNEIAKNKHGGKVYLTSEAREYLDLWLKERDEYIKLADMRTEHLVESGAKPRPIKDQRLFAISYKSAQKKFSRLYDSVDGSRGKYHRECTIHSCRKYFRTHAAEAMHPDLVTGLMRQTGYLDSTYVRMSDEEKYQKFKAGEPALYITRADHRIQDSKLSKLDRENKELRERLQRVEDRDNAMAALDVAQRKLTSEDHAAIAKLVAEELKKK